MSGNRTYSSLPGNSAWQTGLLLRALLLLLPCFSQLLWTVGFPWDPVSPGIQFPLPSGIQQRSGAVKCFSCCTLSFLYSVIHHTQQMSEKQDKGYFVPLINTYTLEHYFGTPKKIFYWNFHVGEAHSFGYFTSKKYFTQIYFHPTCLCWNSKKNRQSYLAKKY